MSVAISPPATPAASPPTGGRALVIAQAAKFVLRAGSAVTLARLLTPDDYGLFGMAVVVQGLLYLVRDLGANAAVQQAGLTRERFDALFRFGVIGGIVIALVCAASGPAAARFYGEPRLVAVLAALALCFPFAGAAAPLQALLYREQLIAQAAIVDTVALGVSCVAAVIAAAAGAGAWSLVAMALASELTAFLGVWRVCPWRPRWSRALLPWRQLVTFGAELSITNVAGYFTRTCDQIVVGRTAGAVALGVYGRGVQATTLPMQFTVAPFTGWIIAALARAANDPEAYRRFFRTALNGLAHLTLPIAAACVAVPDLLVAVAFGERWLGAAPVVRWLGIALAVQPWAFAPGWLLISTGQTRRLAWLSLLALTIVASAVIGTGRGDIGRTARAMAIGSTVAAILTLALARRGTPATGADIFAASWRPALLSGGFGAVLFLTRTQVGDASRMILSLSLCGVAAGYALSTFAVWPEARAECRRHFLWQR
jgi:O-antigen/teichoic acid export membrane protein